MRFRCSIHQAYALEVSSTVISSAITYLLRPCELCIDDAVKRGAIQTAERYSVRLREAQDDASLLHGSATDTTGR